MAGTQGGDQPHRGGTRKRRLGSVESGYIPWCTHCSQMPVWSTQLWLLAKCLQSRDEHGSSNPSPESPPVHRSHSGGRADHSHRADANQSTSCPRESKRTTSSPADIHHWPRRCQSPQLPPPDATNPTHPPRCKQCKCSS